MFKLPLTFDDKLIKLIQHIVDVALANYRVVSIFQFNVFSDFSDAFVVNFLTFSTAK